MSEIIKILYNRHCEDGKQLEVIFPKDSEANRIIVEAPAGYGKTRTMISKMAYLIASNQIPNSKKILALTFSVNAAYKIKMDISKDLTKIFTQEFKSPPKLRNKIFATNYHGFCRRILKLYGNLVDSNLKKIDILKGIDGRYNELNNIGLNHPAINEITTYHSKIIDRDIRYIEDNMDSYLDTIKNYVLPKGYIPFNAILLFTLEIFRKYPNVLNFYKLLYPIIFVDEFQDTNLLSWLILEKLFEGNSQITLMGDSLQRIYGFIGACPDIMPKIEAHYKMKRIELETNHRFKNNPSLLNLDKTIRANAKNIQNPQIEHPVSVKVFPSSTQEVEAQEILKLVKRILYLDHENKIAILVKQRGKNVDKILEIFNRDDINYFNALFSEENPDYIIFHHETLNEFIKSLSNANGKFNRSLCRRFLKKITLKFEKRPSSINESLLQLLYSFLKLVFFEYKFLSLEEKIEFIKDTLENRALKQYLDTVDSNVLISTVHGAKGLEWDYSILPDIERRSFPSQWVVCDKLCKFREEDCLIEWDKCDKNFENKFFEELSLFYVAATRAQKDVYFSYSKKPSCLLKLKGLKISNISII